MTRDGVDLTAESLTTAIPLALPNQTLQILLNAHRAACFRRFICGFAAGNLKEIIHYTEHARRQITASHDTEVHGLSRRGELPYHSAASPQADI